MRQLLEMKKIFMMLLLFPVIVQAQIETRKVKFNTRSNPVVINGSVKGQQTIDYTVDAKSGDELKVTLKTNSNSNFFNLLPPGSQDEAIFIGSNDGNEFGGTLSASGTYKIRVYMYRNAARDNKSATFTLKITLKSASGNAGTNDSKVPGTKFNATGQLKTAMGDAAKGSSTANFGVIRMDDGTAEVHVSPPGGLKRIFFFKKGEWSCLVEGCKITYGRTSVDEWKVTVNDYEHYFIPEAVITGG